MSRFTHVSFKNLTPVSKVAQHRFLEIKKIININLVFLEWLSKTHVIIIHWSNVSLIYIKYSRKMLYLCFLFNNSVQSKTKIYIVQTSLFFFSLLAANTGCWQVFWNFDQSWSFLIPLSTHQIWGCLVVLGLIKHLWIIT